MSEVAPRVAEIPQQLDFHQIAKMLPFGTSWLLLDRVLYWHDRKIVAQKAISGGETNMSAHLKDGPAIMPGVLQIEFVNQALLLLCILNISKRNGLVEIRPAGAGVLARCKAAFHSPAFVGDVLTATVEILDTVGGKTMFKGELSVGDRKVASVEAIGVQVEGFSIR